MFIAKIIHFPSTRTGSITEHPTRGAHLEVRPLGPRLCTHLPRRPILIGALNGPVTVGST
jgi:hypothetical protein